MVIKVLGTVIVRVIVEKQEFSLVSTIVIGTNVLSSY